MVAAFFRKLSTPVDVVREVFVHGVRESSSFGVVGILTMVIGGLVWTLTLFPSGREVWWINGGLGAVLLAIGGLMVTSGKRSERAFLAKMRAAGEDTK